MKKYEQSMISVIIPTRNRCKSLNRTLESIEKCKYDDLYEIIVVDNGSSDATHSVCEKKKKNLPIRYIYDERPGLHVGRNVGYQQSKGEILVYLDDDVILQEQFLQTVSEYMNTEEKIGLLTGNVNFITENGQTVRKLEHNAT